MFKLILISLVSMNFAFAQSTPRSFKAVSDRFEKAQDYLVEAVDQGHWDCAKFVDGEKLEKLGLYKTETSAMDVVWESDKREGYDNNETYFRFSSQNKSQLRILKQTPGEWNDLIIQINGGVWDSAYIYCVKIK
jgi:hypothetical protein